MNAKKISFASEINRALSESLESDKNVMVGGQLVKYGVAGLTNNLYEKFTDQFITYPVSESLMNSSAMGLALAGKRVVLMHVRIDFLASGMCALVNHIPIWHKKGLDLPITLVCQIGKGMGQGAQHSKDLSYWFEDFEGWNLVIPNSPELAYSELKKSIFGKSPTIYVIHRELFDKTENQDIATPHQIRLCGASQRHEKEFYGDKYSPASDRVIKW